MTEPSTQTKYANAKELQGLTLGQSTQYSHDYDPRLLQPVPRRLNRHDLGLTDEQVLPFAGCDIWTMYELSWLNEKGLPQVAIGDVFLPITSENLIESKSFKLYLNSLNQTRFNSRQQVETTLAKDLSHCAQSDVDVKLHPLDDYTSQPITTMQGQCIDEQDIEINDYQFNSAYLSSTNTLDSNEIITETLYSHLLKSNCLITNQPDWGSIEIAYTGKKIDQESLLRYLVSFRQHNEFHEQCVERIFCDIMKYYQPQTLSVYARYTRRGGLDINPFRSTHLSKPHNISRMARQ